MKENAIRKLLNEFKKLSVQEREKFLNYISINSTPADEKHIIDTKFADGLVCPHCGASGKGVYKRGKAANGKQRFYCNHCNHSFSATTGSITYNSKLSFNVWKKYISCFMTGLSVRESAEQCQISVLTSWRLRHKICDSLHLIMSTVQFNSITEVDETYFRLSYKGNHKKDGFKMPRKVNRRGKSIFHNAKRGLSQTQVCVPCAVNRSGKSVSRISEVGNASYNGIMGVLKNHINAGATICCDGGRSYKRIANELICEHHCSDMKKSFYGKSIYNIQHINSYHSKLKIFMEHFMGVATKHLNNYLVWFNFSKFAKETNSEKIRILTHHIITANCYTKVRDISNRPAIPYINSTI